MSKEKEKKSDHKERHRIAQQKYREKNKDILKVKDKIYRENNKDKIRARNKVWQEKKKREQKNKDKLIEELKRKVDSQLSLLNTIRTILVNTVAENQKLREENKKLKETIKDHQFYEEKLEHRIIEFEELLHWE